MAKRYSENFAKDIDRLDLDAYDEEIEEYPHSSTEQDANTTSQWSGPAYTYNFM